MESLHITEAELAGNVGSLIDRVRAGAEIVIERDAVAVATLKSANPVPGRKLSDCIALAKAWESRLGAAPVPDDTFAADVQSGIDLRRDSFEPPTWE